MRRAFRRQIRRTRAVDVPPILQRANNLLDKGEFERAAEAFEQLADAAEKRGGPRAPFFYLQAGRAWMLASNPGAALDHFKRALGLFASRGQLPKVHAAGRRIAQELDQRGHAKQSEDLKTYMHELLPGPINFSEPITAPSRPRLPTHCPSCGGALRSDEVEWIDEGTAACAYCGSPVHAGE